MRGAVLREIPGKLEIEQVRLADAGPREVRVRVVGSGLCHSDLHLLKGDLLRPLPVLPGHEASGVVEQVGEMVTYVKPGDHVIACTSAFCGHCADCLTGHPNLCSAPELRRGEGQEARISSDSGEPIEQFADIGGFAEEMLLHENALVKIDSELPLDTVAIIGCAAVTGMGAVFNTARVPPGARVVVIGAGGIGLHAIQGASIAGARQVIAVDLNPAKLERARSMGATDTVNASDSDPVEAVLELTRGGADYTFEAIGLPKTAVQCVEMLRAGGTATIIGVMPQGSSITIDGSALLMDKRLIGCIMGSNRFRVDIPLYLDYYRQGRLDLDHMISRRISLEEINEGYAALETSDIARSVITFS
jgi:S-(hydroxymethyl)glutathione dehydrogenase / alcohol dehydrogenase